MSSTETATPLPAIIECHSRSDSYHQNCMTERPKHQQFTVPTSAVDQSKTEPICHILMHQNAQHTLNTIMTPKTQETGQSVEIWSQGTCCLDLTARCPSLEHNHDGICKQYSPLATKVLDLTRLSMILRPFRNKAGPLSSSLSPLQSISSFHEA